MKHTVAIADDHKLIVEAISGLIQKMDNYEVVCEANNGRELINCFNAEPRANIVVLDVNMPEMDGFETALWLKNNHPNVKVLAISMQDRTEIIIKMLRNGAKGYLLKGFRSFELKDALDKLAANEFYYSEFVTDELIKSLDL